uniref:BHLH domain-containing protein n=1 Tax=Brassica oleracea var. oleracea TaxID=109376 RepID=A0A0D3DZA5_BRAOL
MLNNQDFMGLEWTNDVESLALKDQDISVRARSDEDRITNGLKWSDDYFYYHQANFHLQIVPENRKEEENSEKDLTLVVPDEHSETGDHHLHIKDYSEYNRRFLRNKHAKPKRRRVQILSDDESEDFSRKVPLVTRKSSKRRIRDDMMSNKMRTLQQLVPNCHKTDKVSVLDKTIEYMKNLQLQLQVMSIMGTNPYIPQATLDFGMHNQLLTAMGIAHGLNPAKQTTLSPLIAASNWPSPPFSNLSFPHSSNQSLFPPPASSPQCLCGLVRCFPTFFDFSSHTMGGRL